MKLRFLTRILPRPVSMRDQEMAYLNQSFSLADLEYREREIGRGKFRRRSV